MRTLKYFLLSVLLLAGCGGESIQNVSPKTITGSTQTPTTVVDFTPPAGDPHTTTIVNPATGLPTLAYVVPQGQYGTVIQSYPVPVVNPQTGQSQITQASVGVPEGTIIYQGQKLSLVPSTFPLGNLSSTTGSSSGARPQASQPGLIPVLKFPTPSLNLGSNILTKSIQSSLAIAPHTQNSVFSVIVGPSTVNTFNYLAGSTLLFIDTAGTKLTSEGTQTDYELVMPGPLQLSQTVGSVTNVLTINQALVIHWNKYQDSFYPSATNYTLPANGGSLYGASLTLSFPGLTTGTGTAVVTYGVVTKRFTAQMQQTTASDGSKVGVINIVDANRDDTDPLPQNGVDIVAIDLNNLG